MDPAVPVIDWEKSQGARLFDLNSGKAVIDFASHYASLPLGYNHPKFFDSEYEQELLKVSRVKIANLDILSEAFNDFLQTFIRVVGPAGFEKYFFVDGGGLGVENAMKAAFDWKVHRNLRNGKGERGYKILHFREAFHGRTGYTLSVTNTQDPNKTRYFAKFDWPRVMNPKMRFPMTGENLEATLEDEEASKQQIEDYLSREGDDIAAILLEPIQGEGGDNHFRPEFLQYLRKAADEHDVLLIFDEVQTGMGMTGDPWAFQTLGVEPDLVCFAKKAQTGGFMTGPRLLQEEKNVFTVPSRISSTWGGSLTDMIRCKKYLEVIEEENLLKNVRERGKQAMEALEAIAQRTELIHNVRGRGLFVAFDLNYAETRGAVIETLYDKGLMVLPSGARTVRFRPHLNVTSEVMEEATSIVEKTLKSVEVPVAKGI